MSTTLMLHHHHHHHLHPAFSWPQQQLQPLQPLQQQHVEEHYCSSSTTVGDDDAEQDLFFAFEPVPQQQPELELYYQHLTPSAVASSSPSSEEEPYMCLLSSSSTSTSFPSSPSSFFTADDDLSPPPSSSSFSSSEGSFSSLSSSPSSSSSSFSSSFTLHFPEFVDLGSVDNNNNNFSSFNSTATTMTATTTTTTSTSTSTSMLPNEVVVEELTSSSLLPVFELDSSADELCLMDMTSISSSQVLNQLDNSNSCPPSASSPTIARLFQKILDESTSTSSDDDGDHNTTASSYSSTSTSMIVAPLLDFATFRASRASPSSTSSTFASSWGSIDSSSNSTTSSSFSISSSTLTESEDSDSRHISSSTLLFEPSPIFDDQATSSIPSSPAILPIELDADDEDDDDDDAVQNGKRKRQRQVDSTTSLTNDEKSTSKGDVYADVSTSNVLVKLFHKPRGMRGAWLEVNSDDRIRVTKGKGKRLRVQVSSRRLCESIIASSLDDVSLTLFDCIRKSQVPPEEFEIDERKSSTVEGDPNTIVLEVNLKRLSKSLQFGVRIRSKNHDKDNNNDAEEEEEVVVKGRSIRFTTHNNGKDRSSGTVSSATPKRKGTKMTTLKAKTSSSTKRKRGD